ncbi:hypothetical protein HP555_11090 [Desulfobulbus oligotrophicus]|uniref:Uncharacterized protein n=1 Tax=Desulfobulbus oligotrophicus TaxID=1909699 RepID=A0A7T5VED7_9BACT|nr:hypothetical protein HP555_11090 [Desulfobulbus oligotrophicus]
MMHQLTVDSRHCRGLHLCHQCEAITPGLVHYCEMHGRVLISWPNTAAKQPLLSKLIVNCPDRAIMMKPVE